MGLVLGKVTVETPKYDVLGKEQDFEIREYGSNLVAEVTYDPGEMKGGSDGGFMVLASYIGALGKPNNVKAEDKGESKAGDGEKIAMTAPVITQETQTLGEGEKIAMTAPVITQETETLGEGEKIAMTAPVLTKQGEAENIAMTAPVITEEKQDKTQEGKKMMTMQFVLPSKYSLDSVPRPTDPRVLVKEVPKRKYGVLTFSGIADDKLVDKKLGRLRKALEDAGFKVTGDHILARYNPPWTVPFLRTNEVMLPVE